MRELGHLLRELDPPPDGLLRLQRAVETRDLSAQRQSHRSSFFAAGCALLTVALVAWHLPSHLATRKHTAMLLQVMQPAATSGHEGIHVKNGSALELPSGQPNARVYLVQTTTP